MAPSNFARLNLLLLNRKTHATHATHARLHKKPRTKQRYEAAKEYFEPETQEQGGSYGTGSLRRTLTDYRVGFGVPSISSTGRVIPAAASVSVRWPVTAADRKLANVKRRIAEMQTMVTNLLRQVQQFRSLMNVAVEANIAGAVEVLGAKAPRLTPSRHGEKKAKTKPKRPMPTRRGDREKPTENTGLDDDLAVEEVLRAGPARDRGHPGTAKGTGPGRAQKALEEETGESAPDAPDDKNPSGVRTFSLTDKPLKLQRMTTIGPDELAEDGKTIPRLPANLVKNFTAFKDLQRQADVLEPLLHQLEHEFEDSPQRNAALKSALKLHKQVREGLEEALNALQKTAHHTFPRSFTSLVRVLEEKLKALLEKRIKGLTVRKLTAPVAETVHYIAEFQFHDLTNDSGFVVPALFVYVTLIEHPEGAKELGVNISDRRRMPGSYRLAVHVPTERVSTKTTRSEEGDYQATNTKFKSEITGVQAQNVLRVILDYFNTDKNIDLVAPVALPIPSEEFQRIKHPMIKSIDASKRSIKITLKPKRGNGNYSDAELKALAEDFAIQAKHLVLVLHPRNKHRVSYRVNVQNIREPVLSIKFVYPDEGEARALTREEEQDWAQRGYTPAEISRIAEALS